MNKWNGTGWDKISGEAQDFDYNSLTNKPSINGTILQGNVQFDFLTIDDLEELNSLIDSIEVRLNEAESSITALDTRVDNIMNGTTPVPQAESAAYSYGAATSTNTHLIDGKEISEYVPNGGTVWTCTYNNGAITLPEGKTLVNGAIQPIQFIAPTAASSSTTFSIVGIGNITAKIQNGSELPETIFAANSVVFCVLNRDSSGAITINFKPGGGGINLDALSNPASASDILRDENNIGKEAYDDQGNVLTGTIFRLSNSEQATVTNVSISEDDNLSTYGNITANGTYKIVLSPNFTTSGRFVPNGASFPTYINVNYTLPTTTTAVASDILSGKTAYNNNSVLITGNMTNRSGSTQTANGSLSGTNFRLKIPNSGYYDTSSYLSISKTSALNVILPTAPSNYNPASASNVADGYYAYDRSGNLLRGTAEFSNVSSSSSTHVQSGYYAYDRSGNLIKGTGQKITTATTSRTIWYSETDYVNGTLYAPRGTPVSAYISTSSSQLRDYWGKSSVTLTYIGDRDDNWYFSFSLKDEGLEYFLSGGAPISGSFNLRLTYQY